MTIEPDAVTLTLERTDAYLFSVRVESERKNVLVTGEGPPLGAPGGFTPIELLGAAVATCLASSLLFCVSKARVDVEMLTARIRVGKTRTAKGRLRVGHIDVTIDARVPDAERERFERCKSLFEEYCVVTESVRNGIPVTVHVALT